MERRERDDQIKSRDYVASEAHLSRYRYAGNEAGKKVLDLGCGYGYGSKMLYDGGREVTAVDLSPDAINYAKKNYPGPDYLVQSAEEVLPFSDEMFDSVTAFEVIEHLHVPERFLSEIYRVLKKRGTLFISTPNPRHLANIIRHYLLGRPLPLKMDENNPYHIREYYYLEFIGLLKKTGFKIEKTFGQVLTFGGKRFLNSKLFAKLMVLSGYFFPKYSLVVVVKALKE